MLPLKTFPWKPLGSLGLLSMSCLFSLLGNCNKHCTFLHYNLGSVNWLHTVERTQVSFSNRTPHYRVEGEHQTLKKPSLERWASWPILRADSWTFRSQEALKSGLSWTLSSAVKNSWCQWWHPSVWFSASVCHTCGKGKLPAIPVNNKCCPPSSHQPLQLPYPPTHPSQCTLRGIQDGEKQEIFCPLDTGPS